MYSRKSNPFISSRKEAEVREVDTDHSDRARTQTPVCLYFDSRRLDRDCFAQAMAAHAAEMRFTCFGSLQEWLNQKRPPEPGSVVLLNLGGSGFVDQSQQKQISRFVKAVAPAPVVAMADTEKLEHVIPALEAGAAGYIATDIDANIVALALKVAAVGGCFVPATCLTQMDTVLVDTARQESRLQSILTSRQIAILAAIERGKPNKVIAREFGIKESTVKVHIRDIMGKLKATTRTEILYNVKNL